MENNLREDAATYGASLQSYNVGENQVNEENEKLKEKADDSHEEWSTPVNVLGAGLVGKPVKTLIKKVGAKLIKKGVKTGENILKDRVGALKNKVQQKLNQSLGKIKGKVQSEAEKALEAAKSKLSSLKSSAEEGISSAAEKSGFNQVRENLGQKPLANNNPFKPKPAEEDGGGGGGKPDEDGGGGGGKPEEDGGEGAGDEGGATPRDTGLGPENKPDLSDPLGQEQTREERGEFDDADETPPTAEPTAPPAAGEEGLGLDVGADDLAGAAAGAGADLAAGAAGAIAPAVAEIAAPVAGTLAEGLGAAAAAEGGFNPIADIGAAIAGVIALVEGTHKAPTPVTKFNPANPIIEHGI